MELLFLLRIVRIVPSWGVVRYVPNFHDGTLLPRVRTRKCVIASRNVFALVLRYESKVWRWQSAVGAMGDIHNMVGAKIFLTVRTISSPHALFIGLDEGKN